MYNEKNAKINELKCSIDLLKLSIIDHAIYIHLPNKIIYPYPLLTLSILSSQYKHQYPLN